VKGGRATVVEYIFVLHPDIEGELQIVIKRSTEFGIAYVDYDENNTPRYSRPFYTYA